MHRKTRELLELDRKHVWHPFTQMQDYENMYHVPIVGAEGIKLFDAYGNYYYDTISSWWCKVLGHNVKEIQRAMIKQMRKYEHVMFAGLTHEPGIRLASKLIEITHPGLQHVFYSDNGSTSVEVALKIAVQYWTNKGIEGKNRFICLENGYHGDTLGAMSVSGTSQFFDPYKALLFDAFRSPSPYCYRCMYHESAGYCDYECLVPLRDMLEKAHERIAAVVLEPLVQAAGGMIVYPVEYLDRLMKIVRQYDVLVIFDEIATGFGRTGKLFAYEYLDDSPDILCVSKALTNGTLPLAATIVTDEIYFAFYDDYLKGKTFFHGHTFTANPIACAAALKTIELIEKKNLVKKFSKKRMVIEKYMGRLENFEFFGDIRSIGTIVAFELVKNKKTKERFEKAKRISWQICRSSLRYNIILRPLGDVLYFNFPLSVKISELGEIFGIFERYASEEITTICGNGDGL